MAKLTVSMIKDIKYDHKSKTIWDDMVKGFGVRIQKESASYIVKYRNQYKQQKMLTIGKTDKIPLEEARRLAKNVFVQLAAGKDPAQRKTEDKKALTISDLCDWYMKEGVSHKKESTLKIDRGRIERHIKPLIGKIVVKNLSRGNVETMMYDIQKGDKIFVNEKTKKRGRSIVSGGDTAASRTVQLLGAILKFAIDHNIIDNNPAHGIKKPKAKTKDVFLNIQEIKNLGKILDAPYWKTLHKNAINAIKLLILTGCRKTEILSLKWEYVDFEYQCFRFPDTKTGKQNRPFGRSVLNLLNCMKKETESSDWVFPAKTGNGHYIGLPKIFQEMLKTTDNENKALLNKVGVTLHTLRHTFASIGADMGFIEFTLAGLLGHHLQGTTNRYSHAVDKSLIKAADEISSKIENALNGIEVKTAEIISIAKEG